MIEWEEKRFNLPKQGVTYLYLYTPMCGTCQVAKRMLSVVEELFPTIRIYSLNLNYFPSEAKELEIESVPCLLILENGLEKERVYAFQSVGFLHELIKKYSR
ncbi:thioredoxin family protein [Metabacillus litoralis]|jgi:thioredoxin 1|uniref:thioredoxin family protein n=1 Tax=Metabacillus litoralis TaxID=152268 RepID=UPI002040E290|nr:thioredoxin family protein [Metabacillus litoralis]MCM3651550.1 thioredoxin family protein [Metabacillus litoralis]